MKLPIQKLLQIIHRTNIDHQNGRQEPLVLYRSNFRARGQVSLDMEAGQLQLL